MKKRIFSIFTVILLLVSLVGCARRPKPTNGVVGTWENTVDISEYLRYYLGDSVFAGYIQLSDIPLYLLYSFAEDGTFAVKVNTEKTQKSWDKFLDAIEEGMKAAYKASNPEGSIDEFFAAYEKDTGSTVRETLEEKNKMSTFIEPFENNGYYKVQGNRLYRSDKPLEITDKTPYEIFSIEKSKLTILSSTDPSLSTEEKSQYPYEFYFVSQ